MAFLALCVAPTLVLVGWLAWRVGPGRVEGELERLGERLGVRVSADRLLTPTPGARRLLGVTLADPETGAELATLDHLELRPTPDGWLGRGGELRVAGPLALGRGAIDRLVRGAWPAEAVRLRLDRVVLDERSGAGAAWRAIDATLADGPDGRRLSLASGDDPARLRVERNRRADPPRTRVEIDHAGELLLTRPAGLLGDDSGLTTDGPITLRIDHLRLVDGRATRADIAVTAGPGRARHELILAAHQQLGCGAAPLLHQLWPQASDRPPHAPLRFDELSLRLSLRGGRCSLSGVASDSVLARRGEPLLLAPTGDPPPVARLLSLATPDAAAVTPRVLALARWLPLR